METSIAAHREELVRARHFGEGFLTDAIEMLRTFRGSVTSTTKGPFDVVTEADLAVETAFQKGLREAFPDHGLVGEEGIANTASPESGFCWVIDPLDGTVNFAAGLPISAISLAVLYDGRPLLGWVADINRDEIFRATRGEGATLNGLPLYRTQVPNRVLPVGASTGFIASCLERGDGSLERILREFGRFRIFGSQALQLCYVAAGRLRVNLSCEAKLWDDAAGALIACETGCRYSGLEGQPIFPIPSESPWWNGASIGSICGDPQSHGTLLEALTESVL